MKMTNLLSACLMLIAVSANAGERPLDLNINPYDIKCTTNFCRSLSRDQKYTLDQLIEDEIRKQNLNNDADNIAIMVQSSQIDLFGKELSKKQSSAFETEQTDSLMAFRYSPFNKDTYFSANLLLAKGPIQDDKEMHVDLNVIGFGKQFKDNWIVEVGIIKDFKKKPGVTASNKIDLGPNGVLLMLRKKW